MKSSDLFSLSGLSPLHRNSFTSSQSWKFWDSEVAESKCCHFSRSRIWFHWISLLMDSMRSRCRAWALSGGSVDLTSHPMTSWDQNSPAGRHFTIYSRSNYPKTQSKGTFPSSIRLKFVRFLFGLFRWVLFSFTRDTLYGLGRLETLEMVDMGRIDRFDSDVFSHLHNLRTLAVETYPNIEKYRFRLGKVTEGKKMSTTSYPIGQ